MFSGMTPAMTIARTWLGRTGRLAFGAAAGMAALLACAVVLAVTLVAAPPLQRVRA